MKRSSLILFVAAWCATVAIAFTIGRSAQPEGTEVDAGSPWPVASGGRTTPAATVAAASPPGEAESPASESGTAIADFLEGEAGELDLSTALARIHSLTPRETRDLLPLAFELPRSDPNRSRILGALLARLATTEPREALQLANEIGSLRDTERAKSAILEVWGRSDPVAALEWARTALSDQPSGLARTQRRAILRGYAQANPEAAFRYANSLDESTESARREKTWLLDEVIETQVRNGGLEQARNSVESLPEGPMKESMLREMVNEWASFDPESAAAYVSQLGPEASSDLKRTLIRQWAENDPAAAAAWLSSLPPDDPAIARSTADIIRDWTRYDLNAPAEWLNSLPASPELDRAVASYTFRAAEEDPQNAMSWAESITNDRMRTRMMERVAATWKDASPEEFESYLDSSDFSEEEKESLQNAQGVRRWGRGR